MRKREKKERQARPDRETLRWRQTLRWRLMLFILGIILSSGVITAVLGMLIFMMLGWLPAVIAVRFNTYFLIIALLVTCAIVSVPLSGIFGKFYLRPTKALIAATKEVKKGNFEVQVPVSNDRAVHTEMDDLIDNFNEMVRELNGIEVFRNDFINNFSHEFKTPIVSIRGFAKELQFGDLSEAERAEYAKIIAEEADRLAKLSISVLELSKLENQQIVTDQTKFSLDEQIRQCILLQEADWSRKGIDIIPELEETLFYGNEELLAHIWSNLISNAIKFTGEGGIVTIRLTSNETTVTVEVRDTGMGMSEETRRHIFEKFYQGDRSHTHTGYGIGLAIVGRAVSLCGGEIAVESALGEGSLFTVTLPRQADATLPS